jgi:hypothetical protein
MSSVSGLLNLQTSAPDAVNLRLISFLGWDVQKLGATCKKFDVFSKHVEIFKLISNEEFLRLVANYVLQHRNSHKDLPPCRQASPQVLEQGLQSHAKTVKADDIQPGINRYRMRPNIYVDTSDVNFFRRVESDLKCLESHEVGRRLITRISAGKHAVYISEGTSNFCTSLDSLAARTRGLGCSAKISYSLNSECLFDSKGSMHKIPPFLMLAHELIHAYHSSNGKNVANATAKQLSECAKQFWTNREEVHTIRGFPSKNSYRSKPKISEDAIREEHGYPVRFGHVAPLSPSEKTSPLLQFSALTQRVSDVFFKKMINPHSSPPVVHTITHLTNYQTGQIGYLGSHKITPYSSYQS